MRSPSAMTRTSPGTSERASISWVMPSLIDCPVLGEVALESLDCPFCLSLLDECEDRVQKNHRDDRAAERGGNACEGEGRGEPEQ